MFNNFKKIGEDIYVYENFLSLDQCNDIVNFLELLEEDKWVSDSPYFENVMRRTEPISNINEVRIKIESLIPEGWFLGPSTCAVRMQEGSSWGEHADVHDFAEIEEKASLYVEGMPYEEKDLSIYGTVVYFNKFEGGEIYYPTQGIEYSPNPGDLVIHSSSPECLHGVKKVISEKRYSYSNHIYKKIKVPV
jgi:hypothetical protein